MTVVQIDPYDPESAPPVEVIDVMERGLVQITRRVEFYQQDAVTRWNPNGADEEVARLIDGSISVDYSSDERRKLDLTLENIDKALRPNPFGGLWYDKVIKVFRGVSYASGDVHSPVVIVEAQGGLSTANRVKQQLAEKGFTNVMIDLGQTDVAVMSIYSYVVSAMIDQPTAIASQLAAVYDRGKTVLTIGVGNTVTQLPHYATTPAVGAGTTFGVDPVTTDNPAQGAWTSEAATPTAAGTAPSGTVAGVTPLADWPAGSSPTMVTAALARNVNGGFWLDIHLPNVNGTQARTLMGAILSYTKNITPYKTWETQLGEFYIDTLAADDFPNTMKVTGRDGTIKMMNSKLARTSTFVVGTSLLDFVVGQAALSGVPVSKMRFNIGNETLTSDMTFDKGTSRWDMVKSALESYNYERFFDGFGNFVVRPYLDPSTSPVTWTFSTGPKGNLVSFNKAINSTRIYNHVIVTADPSDGDSNPIGYFGEAKVTDPTSPTHESRLGDRVLTIDAPWLGSDAEAQSLADDRLKITALESYEISWDSIYYPWLECGEIIQFLDPDAFDFEPDRFLMDSISYGLGLGPMSATGKRVTFVGSPGGTATVGA